MCKATSLPFESLFTSVECADLAFLQSIYNNKMWVQRFCLYSRSIKPRAIYHTDTYNRSSFKVSLEKIEITRENFILCVVL